MSFHGNFVSNNQRLLYLLESSSKFRSFNRTKCLHALAITLAPNLYQPIFFSNNIISLYASSNGLPMARKLFDKMPERNIVSYNTMISAYSKHGNVEEAWGLFSEMRGVEFYPTQFTLSGLLSCVTLDLCRGVQLQALSVKNGLSCVDAFVGTALMSLYGKHGCLDEVVLAFEDMPRKSLATWNSIICLFGQHGLAEDSVFSFRELVREGTSLSECSFVGALSGFENEQHLEFGKQIHGLVIKFGFDYVVSVTNSLINMYAKCVGLCFAEKIFQEVPVRDVVSWNTMIGASAKSENPKKALEHLVQMSLDGVLPNQITFSSVINSCTTLQITGFGECIHAKSIKSAFESDVSVGSALVDFYAKCDRLEDAHRSFNEIHEKNVVSWNALIWGYANKCSSTSVYLLLEMLRLGSQPNEFTLSSVLKSASVLELRQIHCSIIRMGYQNNEYAMSSLITSYAKNALISDALTFVKTSDWAFAVVPSNNIAAVYNRFGHYHETVKLLSQLEKPDIVSWNTVIAACSRSGDYKEVFELFKHMLAIQIYPDKYTFVSLLSVCSKLCNLAVGSSIHGLMTKTDINHCDTFVHNVLLDMYGKCGNIENSVKIFEGMTDRNLVTWTALISALGLNGYACEALERFRDMEFAGFKPDGVAFIAVLTACRHGGLLREGMELFEKLKKIYGIEPDRDHYHCIVDLLARYGHLKEAEDTISRMPVPPNALIWRSFLEGVRRHRTVQGRVVDQ
ncbi:PPR domain-containing protein/PPR_2 domain-containing protein/PPR_3 domain-containing protein [Cephalotus follicularis]|uniref:PPR domain-containing protein/PPR_2 domain-containing protein/PPR_3 domain-containing protein n=1 Tax=Cephalotus follicularis TaxID=3775 RepID=A0A1Q3C6Z7_CEPFO|nr:PPR domain-containing protein/PPR_2 domain-containing protein/PPR_3 domain-containing protein [Cephalotus follicularis]